MMDCYIDIKLRPDPEFGPALLMNTLYAKLHRGLVDIKSTSIGVSFPEAKTEQPTMGGIMRLHGNDQDLERLMGTTWMKGMFDHTSVFGPLEVPDKTEHRVVRRVQAKSNPERMRRRLAKRKGITLNEARELIPDHKAKFLSLPFLKLNSRSTGHPFQIFVDQRMSEVPIKAGFNQFGLSSKATVPWF